MNPDVSIMLGDTKLNYRTAAWIVCNNKVLLHRDENPTPEADFWNMPGGRVKCGESGVDAIYREIEEELGVKLTNGKLIKIMELFFTYAGEKVHELLFVTYFHLPKSHALAKKGSIHSLDNPKQIFKWFDLNEVQNIVCKPVIIYDLTKQKTHKFNYEIGT